MPFPLHGQGSRPLRSRGDAAVLGPRRYRSAAASKTRCVSDTGTRPGLYAGYAVDLDGTVYLGEQLLPGAAETILALRAAGRRVVFLSNNPLLSGGAYAARLTRLGVATSPDEVLNSSGVMAGYLRDH